MPTVEQGIPTFTAEEACTLAREHYGLDVTAHPVPSYQDQNVRLVKNDGRMFVLKIANTGVDPAVLDLETSVLRHLADHHPALPTPHVLPTTGGEYITAVERGDAAHSVRLLTYLPGTLLADVRPHTLALLRSLGGVLGRLDAALECFTHPAMHRAFDWDLKRLPALRANLAYIDDLARRTLVETLLDRFEAEIAPVLPRLRASVIHNDANDYNVLVGDAGRWEKQVTGLIDFGDVVHTCTVCELAVATTYVMLDKGDPLAAAVHVVAGYHAAYPLTEDEVALVFPLIQARLCLSVLMSARQKRWAPDNAYLTVSEQPAWDLLERLTEVHPHFATYTFRAACGLSPCPQAARLTTWLKDNASEIAPVIQPDPREAPVVVFDFSVGSTDWDHAGLTQPMVATDALFDGMRAEGADVGVGRYDEARLVYAAEQFATAVGERRTIHLGLDLFQPAGSPVFAPLYGSVHSLADNNRPLDYGPTIILEHQVEGGITFYTLYGHLSRASLDGVRVGQAVEKGEQIGALGHERENGGWAPHLHLQLITDLLGHEGDFPGVAPPGERAVWTSLSPDPNLLVGIPNAAFSADKLSKEEIVAARARRIGSNLSVSYDPPLHIVRGFMQHLYDAEGRAYLDGVNNVAHVGHSHPRVVRAAQRQMAVLNTNTRYLHEHLVRYAERLTATLPEPLRVCFFVNSGSEANDLALRLARTHTGRRDVIVLDGAYHGHLSSLVAISPYKFDGPGGSGKPAPTHVVPMPDPYRGLYRGEGAGERYATHVCEAVAQAEDGVGAFMAESLLSCGGQIVLPEGFLADAYRHVRAAGGVCIADEVQVGFGRVGTHFWGFETQGVVPDVVTMGKPIGNGHPLAAVVTTPEVAASFANGMEYFNTYGGNPVSCAVGLAVLDVIEEEGLQAKALRVGTHLKAGLEALQARHPIIGDVRGLGLFLGIEFVLHRTSRAPAPEQAAYVVHRMREEGILLSTDGPLHNVIKIKPPLAFTETNADRLVRTLDGVLEEDFAQVR